MVIEILLWILVIFLSLATTVLLFRTDDDSAVLLYIFPGTLAGLLLNVV